MKKLVEYQIENDSSIIFETDVSDEEVGMIPVSRSNDNFMVKASQSFEDAVKKIGPAAKVIIMQLKNLSDPPNEIELEFGLKTNAVAGFVVTSVGLDANYKVTLRWNKNQK